MVAAYQLASPPVGGGGGGGALTLQGECGGGTRGFIDDCKTRRRAYIPRARDGV